jgi:hypothetical protein
MLRKKVQGVASFVSGRDFAVTGPLVDLLAVAVSALVAPKGRKIKGLQPLREGSRVAGLKRNLSLLCQP